MRDRAVWLLRGLWFILPLLLRTGFGDATASLDSPLRLVVIIAAWTVWTLGLLSAAVLLPATLTAIRIIAPAGAAASLWAVVQEPSPLGFAGLAAAAIAAILSLSTLVGDRMVDGASYGDERRMLLRPPTQLALTVLPLIWAVAVIGFVAGPLLLGSQRWVFGAVATAAGWALAGIAVRALHQLSKRWVVFVPNGFVLHDLMALTEPVLFRRTAVERLGAAIAGTPARDLSRGAAGLLIECELADPAPLGLRAPGRPRRSDIAAELVDVRRFLIAPSLPGALLDEAEHRRIAVDPSQ